MGNMLMLILLKSLSFFLSLCFSLFVGCRMSDVFFSRVLVLGFSFGLDRLHALLDIV